MCLTYLCPPPKIHLLTQFSVSVAHYVILYQKQRRVTVVIRFVKRSGIITSDLLTASVTLVNTQEANFSNYPWHQNDVVLRVAPSSDSVHWHSTKNVSSSDLLRK
jgi:hypothetical protein